MFRKTDKTTNKVWMLAAVIGVAALMGLTATAAAGPVPFFQGLGDLPGGGFFSRPDGISADGSTVVGRSTSAAAAGSLEAFRWTAAGGLVGMGDLPGSTFLSSANAVSGNGSVIVGFGTADHAGRATEAFRWTTGSGMVGLGDLRPQAGTLGNPFRSKANDITTDGSVIVGEGTSISPFNAFSFEAFRWTAGGGMIGLGDLPGGDYLSQAFGVSADGSVVVGRGSSSSSNFEAFRWTTAGGMVGLGDLPGGSFSSTANDVSADGSVVVGSSSSALGPEAFRWTVTGGMVGLGDLPGGAFSSSATAISADGSVVVGRGNSAAGAEAFIWDAANGMRSVQDILVNDLGLSLGGFTLSAANGVSADGLTIVGTGINANGSQEAFIARLPEPGTLGLLVFGGGMMLLRRRRSVRMG